MGCGPGTAARSKSSSPVQGTGEGLACENALAVIAQRVLILDNLGCAAIIIVERWSMHEHGIVQGMLKAALDQAAQHNATKITTFNLEISALADESADSLRFYFETLTPGTIAQGARVEIVRVPAPSRCLNCGKEFVRGSPEIVCPQCQSTRVAIEPHDEFRLVSIDVE